MPLETATTISQLQIANPAANDVVSQGDDHLRLIKSVLQSQFPGFVSPGGAVALNSTQQAIDATVNAVGLGTLGTGTTAALVPIGGAIMWWSNTLPNSDSTHWAWCNGMTIGPNATYQTYVNLTGLTSGGNAIAPNLCELIPMGRRSMNGAAYRGITNGVIPGFNTNQDATLGGLIGNNVGQLGAANLPPHTHVYNGSLGLSNTMGISNGLFVSDNGHFHQVQVDACLPGGAAAAPTAGGHAQPVYNTTGTVGGSITLAGSISLVGGVGFTGGISVDNGPGSSAFFNIYPFAIATNWIIRTL